MCKFVTKQSIMKRDKITHAKLLGIKQEDLAMLLGISRSHCAMFEAGQRDIPRSSTALLNEMLAHVMAPQPEHKDTNVNELEASRLQLEDMLRENEYRQMQLTRRIASAVKKHEAEIRFLKLASFLQTRNTSKDMVPGLSKTIAAKAPKPSLIPHSSVLLELQHRKDMLEFEQKLLESKLEQLKSGVLQNIEYNNKISL